MLPLIKIGSVPSDLQSIITPIRVPVTICKYLKKCNKIANKVLNRILISFILPFIISVIFIQELYLCLQPVLEIFYRTEQKILCKSKFVTIYFHHTQFSCNILYYLVVSGQYKLSICNVVCIFSFIVYCVILIIWDRGI